MYSSKWNNLGKKKLTKNIKKIIVSKRTRGRRKAFCRKHLNTIRKYVYVEKVNNVEYNSRNKEKEKVSRDKVRFFFFLFLLFLKYYKKISEKSDLRHFS